VVAISVALAGAQTTRAKTAEQRHFSAEDAEVEKPVPLPPDVLAVLAKDEVVAVQLENENLSAEQIPSEWFSASTVHLRSPGQADLVVMASEPISGANTAYFWVFRASNQGYKLILTTMAHDLLIRNARRNGYRSIEAWAVVTQQAVKVEYRFDGQRYVKYRETVNPL